MKPATFRMMSIALALTAMVGCTSTPQREAEWTDPGLGTQSGLLRGARVMVACDAYDVALRQVCQDRLFAAVRAKGIEPVAIPRDLVLLNDRDLDGQLVASAALLGAKAIFTMTLVPATSSAGSGAALGLGGFSFGGGGGGGIGLSVPIGGGQTSTGFAANGRVTEVSGNRLVWTSSLVASPSRDLNAQFDTLSRAMVDSAQRAGLF